MDRIALIFYGSLKTDARVLREVNSLSELYTIDVFTNQYQDNDRELVNSNVNIYQYAINDKWIFKNLLFEKQYTQLLKKIDPSKYCALICIDYPTLGIGVTLKKRNPKLKLIYDSHEIYVETINQFFPRKGYKKIYGYPLIWMNKWLHSFLEKTYVKQADICITVCQSLSDYFNQKWNKSVYVLRNCPSIQHVKNSTHEHNVDLNFSISKDDFILLYQGDINPGRGLFTMIDVMKNLPSNFKLIILGSGMLLNDLKNKVKNENVHNVFFKGKVPYKELLNYTKLADLGINLIEPLNESKRLSLPNKLFEYMSVGLPFLSNNLPEPVTLVKKYHCGFIVDMKNNEEITSIISSLHKNRVDLKNIGNNGKIAFENELNWENEFIKLMEQLK